MYVWTCSWSNCASDWRDHHGCGARCRKPFKTEKAAKKAAYAHARSCPGGREGNVRKVDGRSVRKW